MSSQTNTIDLNECENEQIHLAGAIRPAGCLLALGIDDLRIQFLSENTGSLLGKPAANLRGALLTDHIPTALATQIKADADQLQQGRRVAHRYLWPHSPPDWMTLLHRVPGDNLVILEVIQIVDAAAETHERLHRIIDMPALEAERDLDRLTGIVAQKIRQFTGYDRVMVYRFADDGSGHVVAEARRSDLESFLGLHYPAADIPKQARSLFVRNRVRVIEDVRYEPVPLLGHQAASDSLDLSLSLLRSVSPIHLEYLANMGVSASLAISLVRDGQLWGMVACHHYAPKHVPPALIAATELLSQLMSVLCERTERNEQSEAASRCQALLDATLDKIGQHDDGMTAGLIDQLAPLATVVAADGIALVDDDILEKHGETPEPSVLKDLAAWLTAEKPDLPFWTEDLNTAWPGATGHENIPPGLLALDWRQGHNSWIFWFRNEVIKSVTWAGNPDKAVARDQHGRLTPRGSFEAWKSEVRGRARKWRSVETSAIRTLRRLGTMQALQDAKELSDGRFLGAVNDPIIIVDLEGQIVEWNVASESRLGLQRARGRHLSSLMQFASQAQMPDLLQQAASGQVWVGEHRASGDPPAYYEVALMPVPGQERASATVAVALRDITERKLLEEQLFESQKMEALGQLTGGLAHNFNNLLTVIMGATEMSISGVEPEHPVQEDLQLIRTTCQDAAKIVRDLMAFAHQDRSTTGQFDVNECVSHLAKLMSRTIRSEISIEIDTPTTSLLVEADQRQIEQVLMNLAINARDAIEGSGKITVRAYHEHLPQTRAKVHDLPAGDYVVIEVIDTGTGIPVDVVDRIFDPFFTTKAESGGTGLGLSSSYGIVKKHGGDLTVKTSADGGSKFMIFLPAITATAKPSDDQPAERDMPRVLLVDDEPGMRKMLARLLGSKDYSVREAASGLAGLDILSSADEGAGIDLLITDQLMPGMVGTELVAKAHQMQPGLPAILMSGHVNDEWPEDSNVLRIIQKPFAPNELLQVINSLLRAP